MQTTPTGCNMLNQKVCTLDSIQQTLHPSLAEISSPSPSALAEVTQLRQISNQTGRLWEKNQYTRNQIILCYPPVITTSNLHISPDSFDNHNRMWAFKLKDQFEKKSQWPKTWGACEGFWGGGKRAVGRQCCQPFRVVGASQGLKGKKTGGRVNSNNRCKEKDKQF